MRRHIPLPRGLFPAAPTKRVFSSHSPHSPPPPPQIRSADRELVGYREQLKRLPPSAHAGVKSKAVQVRGAVPPVLSPHRLSLPRVPATGPEAQEDV